LLIILFSAEQSGQVNRIAHPDLVPATSGFTEWFLMGVFDRFYSLKLAGPALFEDPVFPYRRVVRMPG